LLRQWPLRRQAKIDRAYVLSLCDGSGVAVGVERAEFGGSPLGGLGGEGVHGGGGEDVTSSVVTAITAPASA
jgi:hypothetical protein